MPEYALVGEPPGDLYARARVEGWLERALGREAGDPCAVTASARVGQELCEIEWRLPDGVVTLEIHLGVCSAAILPAGVALFDGRDQVAWFHADSPDVVAFVRALERAGVGEPAYAEPPDQGFDRFEIDVGPPRATWLIALAVVTTPAVVALSVVLPALVVGAGVAAAWTALAGALVLVNARRIVTVRPGALELATVLAGRRIRVARFPIPADARVTCANGHADLVSRGGRTRLGRLDFGAIGALARVVDSARAGDPAPPAPDTLAALVDRAR